MTNVSNDSNKEQSQNLLKRPNLEAYDFPVIGIGASAGGLEALEDFFSNVPKECGMAFVVIQHLSPDFKSIMPELIGRVTEMDTQAAKNDMKVRPNNIYILPPKKNLAIKNMRIVLKDIVRTNIPNRPIDIFFNSLAIQLGPRSGAVVLSGTGSDGTLGIRAIHENNGFVLVQDPKTAKFDGMPRSALSTNIVAASGSPKELAEILVDLVKDSNALSKSNSKMQAPNNDLKKLFTLVENKYDVDFSLYKKPTIHRRLDKRLEHHKCESISEYIEITEKEPQEISTLYHEMLIGVTEFFRDKEAFNILENKIIPKIFKNKNDGDEIRIWVPACASGEEVYSIALLFFEFARINKRRMRIKLFGTDIDDSVLAKASEGFFKENAIKGVRSQLLERYFTQKNDGYLISAKIRKAIFFARNNLLKDPPFTKMDLISCRNLLIYFDKEAQIDAQNYLYFALSQGGYLFLGPSETLGEFERGYETIERKWKFFKKIGERLLPNSKTTNGYSNDILHSFTPLFKKMANRSSDSQQLQSVEIRAAFAKLLHEYVPPSLLVKGDMELHHIFGKAGKYLENKAGPVESNLKHLLTEKLAITIAVGIQRAKKDQSNVSHLGIYDSFSESTINIHVQPVSGGGDHRDGYFLIIFEATDKEGTNTLLDDTKIIESADSFERIQLLEKELQNSRENLQSTIEELETTNEELQSTNEELLATNEELQSTNEELHSVNEELYTVNTEYQSKIDELTQLTNDEENFLKATNIGTIFLCPELKIRKFTPAVTPAINLLPQDIDRPLAHITHNLNVDLVSIVEKVLTTHESVEFESKTDDGKWYIGKVMLYKTKYGDNDGVVLTFTDSTRVKKMETDKSYGEQLLQSVIEDISDGWWDWEIASQESNCYLSPKFKNLLGYKDYEIENSIDSLKSVLDKNSVNTLESAIDENKRTNNIFEVVLKFKHKKEKLIPLKVKGKIISREGRPMRFIGIQQKIGLQ